MVETSGIIDEIKSDTVYIDRNRRDKLRKCTSHQILKWIRDYQAHKSAVENWCDRGSGATVGE
jgi:hypothetical protein